MIFVQYSIYIYKLGKGKAIREWGREVNMEKWPSRECIRKTMYVYVKIYIHALHVLQNSSDPQMKWVDHGIKHPIQRNLLIYIRLVEA